MNLTGKLIKKNQVQTGVNEKNNTEWKNQTLLFEHVGNSFLNEWNNKFAVKVIEKNLDKMNGQVSDNATSITKITTVGTVGILIVPLIVSIIMRLI